MTMEELQQVKKYTEQGIMVSKSTWANVLNWAIELTKHHEGESNANTD